MRLWALHPHMHVRGKDMTYTAIYPDGRRESAAPRAEKSLRLAAGLLPRGAEDAAEGTNLLVTAHFDNSSANKDNPDPSATVRYGDQTWDEMMAGYFVYTIEGRKPPTN